MDYFTSDTHYGHTNILQYCQRPFDSVEAMNRAMIERWNAVVQPGDTVYHLGDFALGPKTLWKTYRYQLRGHIVFVLGNHDAPIDRFQQEVVLPIDRFYSDLVYQSEQFGRVHLSHIPLGGDSGRGYQRAGEGTQADYFLCGHIHTSWLRRGSCINVGVDMWDFTPQTLATIIENSARRLRAEPIQRVFQSSNFWYENLLTWK